MVVVGDCDYLLFTKKGALSWVWAIQKTSRRRQKIVGIQWKAWKDMLQSQKIVLTHQKPTRFFLYTKLCYDFFAAVLS